MVIRLRVGKHTLEVPLVFCAVQNAFTLLTTNGGAQGGSQKHAVRMFESYFECQKIWENLKKLWQLKRTSP